MKEDGLDADGACVAAGWLSWSWSAPKSGCPEGEFWGLNLDSLGIS